MAAMIAAISEPSSADAQWSCRGSGTIGVEASGVSLAVQAAGSAGCEQGRIGG
jgi:hypothetical protein